MATVGGGKAMFIPVQVTAGRRGRSITCKEVDEIVQRAIGNMRWLEGPWHRQYRACWPDYVHSFWDAYGWTEARMPRKVLLSHEITEIDQVIEWLSWLQPSTRAIAFLRYNGRKECPWRAIARIVGMSDKTCKERMQYGMVLIAHEVRKRAVKKDSAFSAKNAMLEGIIGELSV